MCMGSIPWSGVRRLVCGARDEDARRVGFDEGPKARDWVQALTARGIAVVRDVCRQEAAAVLLDYARCGGPVYNARQGNSSGKHISCSDSGNIPPTGEDSFAR